MLSNCYAQYIYQVCVLKAQAIFLSECRHTNTHTHKVTDPADNPTHASAIISEGNEWGPMRYSLVSTRKRMKPYKKKFHA